MPQVSIEAWGKQFLRVCTLPLLSGRGWAARYAAATERIFPWSCEAFSLVAVVIVPVVIAIIPVVFVPEMVES